MNGIENELIEWLSSVHEVDGHGAGASELYIFVFTQYPEQAFKELKHILDNCDCWRSIRIAYREVLGQAYVVLWPEGMMDLSVG